MVNSRLAHSRPLDVREVTEKARAGCIARLASFERPASAARSDPPGQEEEVDMDVMSTVPFVQTVSTFAWPIKNLPA